MRLFSNNAWIQIVHCYLAVLNMAHPIRIISICLIIFVKPLYCNSQHKYKNGQTETYSKIFPEPWSLKDLQRSGEINKSTFQLLTTVWPWIMATFNSMCEYCNSVHYNYNYQIYVPFLLWIFWHVLDVQPLQQSNALTLREVSKAVFLPRNTQ